MHISLYGHVVDCPSAYSFKMSNDVAFDTKFLPNGFVIIFNFILIVFIVFQIVYG